MNSAAMSSSPDFSPVRSDTESWNPVRSDTESWKKATPSRSSQQHSISSSVGSGSTAPLLSSQQQPQPVYSTSSVSSTNQQHQQPLFRKNYYRHRFASNYSNDSLHSRNSGGLGIGTGLRGYSSPSSFASSHRHYSPPYSLTNQQYRWIPWVMRSILASPMIVFVIWTVTWMVHPFSVQQSNATPRYYQQHQPLSESKMKARMLHERHRAALAGQHLPAPNNVDVNSSNGYSMSIGAHDQDGHHNNHNHKNNRNKDNHQKKVKNNPNFIQRHFPVAGSNAGLNSNNVLDNPSILVANPQGAFVNAVKEEQMPSYQLENGQPSGLEAPILYTKTSNGDLIQLPQGYQMQDPLPVNLIGDGNNEQIIPIQGISPHHRKGNRHIDEKRTIPIIAPLGSNMNANTEVQQPLQQLHPNLIVQPRNIPNPKKNLVAPKFIPFDAMGKPQRNGGSRQKKRQQENKKDIAGATERATAQRVYYYDPNAVLKNNGELPSNVYDSEGNILPLSYILSTASENADIFYEPPMIKRHKMTLVGGPGSNEAQMLNQKLSIKDVGESLPVAWGESTLQDQSIIVVTVAVMALLVGALSARRLRSKNILSACIENEALTDDNEHTITYSNNTNNDWGDNHIITDTPGGGNGRTTAFSSDNYHTFYKGDLEKFDV